METIGNLTFKLKDENLRINANRVRFNNGENLIGIQFCMDDNNAVILDLSKEQLFELKNKINKIAKNK